MPLIFPEIFENKRRRRRLVSSGLLAAFLVSLSGTVLMAQEAGFTVANVSVDPVPVDPIPQNFELWQDSEGFLWQLNRQGALGSGDTAYFQTAMALFIKGQSFSPSEATRLDGGEAGDDGARVVLSQKGDELTITRDLWFDRERAGVRVLDVFENTGSRTATFRIDLKTAYQNPWQDLHGTEGRILGAKPGAGLGGRDFGVVVKFSAAEGRHDTLIVTSSERDAQQPMISFASNLREVTLSYDLEIEPGKKAALLHWVAQRNLQAPGDAGEALRPFYQRRQLMNPAVTEAQAAMVRNFEAQSFPKPGVTPFDLEGLVSLNAVTESLGVVRRNEDVLWISSDNQLTGKVNEKASLRVATEWGERETPIAKVAAIQGGSGLGRTPRVFLRDGRVWAGKVTPTDLTMKIAEGWEVEELQPEEISLLLLAVGADDGRPPKGAGVFVELRSGDVLAAKETEGQSLRILTPWGEDSVSFEQVRELSYSSGSSAPRFRLLRSDGSLLTVFLGSDDLALAEAGSSAGESGAALVISPVAVAGAWKPGQRVGRAAGDPADEWFDLEDAVTSLGRQLPDSAVLLSGNNLLAGRLAMERLNLVSGTAVTPIDPAEIVMMRRSLDTESDAAPVFEIELSGGEVLTGRLRERLFEIESGEKRWRVPAAHFIAYRVNEAPSA
ncbi:MAG: hypothetical protein KDN19_02440 [Verrucomicrobiae bacterium]|nr:hypothetical protein [Verrucomicrobiae bacterium]